MRKVTERTLNEFYDKYKQEGESRQAFCNRYGALPKDSTKIPQYDVFCLHQANRTYT
jgi:hypothetical protein